MGQEERATDELYTTCIWISYTAGIRTSFLPMLSPCLQSCNPFLKFGNVVYYHVNTHCIHFPSSQFNICGNETISRQHKKGRNETRMPTLSYVVVAVYYYDVQLPINHVISKTVLHLVTVCITSQKHSKHMLKVCRKFSKKI